jgi:hypothetical protein
MPGEPFLESHAKSVDVFVELLNKGNSLNNGLILPVHVGRALLSGVRVTKTELGSLHVIVLNLLHYFDEVGLYSSLKFSDGFVERGSDSSLGEDSIKREVSRYGPGRSKQPDQPIYGYLTYSWPIYG